jgi:hypothetical protein
MKAYRRCLLDITIANEGVANSGWPHNRSSQPIFRWAAKLGKITRLDSIPSHETKRHRSKQRKGDSMETASEKQWCAT